MSKIKVFRFEISNWSMCLDEKDKNDHSRKAEKQIASESQIEKVINDFLKDKKLIDIKTNTAEVKFHNNGRCNTIHLIYTIVYE